MKILIDLFDSIKTSESLVAGWGVFDVFPKCDYLDSYKTYPHSIERDIDFITLMCVEIKKTGRVVLVVSETVVKQDALFFPRNYLHQPFFFISSPLFFCNKNFIILLKITEHLSR
jgi:hypothetical protein